jgi:hypothetical protein
MSELNDPLDPVYPHHTARPEAAAPRRGLGSRTNLTVLVLLAVVVLIVIIFLGRGQAEPEPPPPTGPVIEQAPATGQ